MWLGGGAHWESERSHRAIPVVLVDARIKVIEVIVIVVARLGYAWRPAFADKNVTLGLAQRWLVQGNTTLVAATELAAATKFNKTCRRNRPHCCQKIPNKTGCRDETCITNSLVVLGFALRWG